MFMERYGKSAWIDEEELHGCSIVWCDNLQQAIKLVQSGTSKEYVHLFERARELAGLKAAISKIMILSLKDFQKEDKEC